MRDQGVGITDVKAAREPLFTTGGAERSGMGLYKHGKVHDKPSGGVPARDRDLCYHDPKAQEHKPVNALLEQARQGIARPESGCSAKTQD